MPLDNRIRYVNLILRSSVLGVLPLYECLSVPQIPDMIIFTTAAPFCGFGYGKLRSSYFPGSFKTIALTFSGIFIPPNYNVKFLS